LDHIPPHADHPGHGASKPQSHGRRLIVGYPRMQARSGKSRVQIWRDIRAGKFPAPIELGPNSVAWFEDEFEAWQASRPRRTYRSFGRDTTTDVA
jgi:prophage regulatory protein